MENILCFFFSKALNCKKKKRTSQLEVNAQSNDNKSKETKRNNNAKTKKRKTSLKKKGLKEKN